MPWIDEVAAVVLAYYDLNDQGNFEGRNILHTPLPPGRVARTLGLTEPALQLAPHAAGERSKEPDVALTPRPPRGPRVEHRLQRCARRACVVARRLDQRRTRQPGQRQQRHAGPAQR